MTRVSLWGDLVINVQGSKEFVILCTFKIYPWDLSYYKKDKFFVFQIMLDKVSIDTLS